MRPDLPWNVAGISTEVREAARAAARREGLSVGEWLSRRIVVGLSDMSEPAAPSNWNARGEYHPEPERQRRDSDAMLDRVSKSETETADVYRRIEDQLRGMARRLDASERSQAESNRVVSKAAVEMNIASREQAQAFDQLGVHVANLTERLDRVEGRDPADGLRDAVKALHQGLSRLADQITQTANQSATQISALAGNLENVAGRVGQARHDSLVATQALESRLAALDERVRTVETAAQANASSLDRALEAIESQRRPATPPDAIVRLEDSVRRLEERSSVDPSLDRRLSGIERGLSDVMARIEPPDEPDSLEDSLKKVVTRLDSLENSQREAAAELRKAAEKVRPIIEEAPPAPVAIVPPPAPPPPPPVMAAAFSPMPAFEPPAFEPPPFADSALPPFAASLMQVSAAPSAGPLGTTALPPFAEAAFDLPPPVEPLEAQATAEAAPTVESYLAAARRSARAAAAQETERASIGGLRWGSAPATAKSEDGKSRTRPLFVGIAALIAIAVIAAMILSRQASHNTPAPEPVGRAAHEAAPAKTASAAPTSLHPSAEETPSLPPQATQPAPRRAANPQASGLMPSGVAAPASQFTPPAHPQTQIAARPAPLDRLTAAANGGNARAQLIVGLKYLDGDGIPNNDGEAAKWISRAAEAGEPVAQYRLGTLLERGRGVAADPAKAVRWYQAAAAQGSRKAMHNLAVAYAEGTGVKRDYAEASRWFLKAANLGLKDSQFNLAVLYERGLGVPQNLIDAYKWYAIAAGQGDAESKSRLGAITGQLDTEARAAAQNAADTFRAGALNARANVAPTVSDVTRG